MIVVMDEGRYTDSVHLCTRQHMMKGFFKFCREGGKVNKNVLRTDRDKGETRSKTGEVCCLSETQFAVWLNFLGSSLMYTPAGDPWFRDFVLQRLTEFQSEVSRLKETYVPPMPAKPVCHDLDIQCDIGDGSLETRTDDSDQSLDT